MPRRFVLALIVLAVSPLSLFAEQAVSGFTIGVASGAMHGASIASDGDGFLAVWVDQRDAGTAIDGARFDESGKLLDPLGIRIASIGADFTRAAVVWTGAAYFVVWSDPYPIGAPSRQVFGRRLDRDGQLIDDAHVLLDGDLNSVAANDNRIVVVSAPNYVVLNQAGERIVYHPGNLGSATVLRRGAGFLFLDLQGSYSRIITLDANGDVVETTMTLSPSISLGSAACSDDSCLVITRDINFSPTISLVRLDADGQRVPSSDSLPMAGTLVSTGRDYVLLGGETYLKLDHSGKPSGAPVAYNIAHLGNAIAVASGSVVGLAWTDEVSAFGGVLDSTEPTLLSRSATRQQNPALAFSGSNFLVSWLENGAVRVGRFGLDGKRLDGDGVAISTGFVHPNLTTIQALFDGDQYDLLWWEGGATNSGVHYARVPVEGPIASGSRKILDLTVSEFQIASNGSSRLMVWSDRIESSEESRIVVAPVLGDGALGTPRVIATISPSGRGGTQYGHPSVAWSGRDWFVAWEVQQDTGFFPEFPSFAPYGIAAVRVDPETLSPIGPPVVLTDELNVINFMPRVASSGRDVIVVWTRGDRSGDTVRMRRLDPNGFPFDPAPITLGRVDGEVEQVVSDVEWDGSRYAVGVTRSSVPHGNGNAHRPDLNDAMVLRVEPYPSFSGVESLIVSATPFADLLGDLTAVGNGAVMAAYSRTDLAAGGVQRVFFGRPRAARSRVVRSR